MTEEELARHDSKTLLQLLLSADARCDALTAEREALEQDNHRWKMECENFWRDREKALTAERDRLRCVTDNHVALCRAEKAEADNARYLAALNQSRLAFAGHVSVQSAIDMIDRASLEEAENEN